MLTLNIIIHNPAAASAMTWLGVILVALLAAVSLSLWVVVARGRAHRAIRDFDDSASDPGLKALRGRRLVVLRTRKPRGAPATIVAELEPTAKPEPTGLKPSR